MPQLNWSFVGPVLLIVTLVASGVIVAVSRTAPRPQHPSVLAATGSPSPAASPVKPASRTPVSVQVQGRAIGTPYLRSQASSDAAVVRELQSGEAVEVSACSQSCTWYQVVLSNGATTGWIPSAFIALQGSDRTLPVTR